MLLLLIEIAAFVAIVILDALGFLPITQTIYLLPFIWIAMKWRKERFRTIGLHAPEQLSISKTVYLGIFLGLSLELFAAFVTTPVLSRIFGADPAVSDLKEIQGNLTLLIFFIMLSWLLAAFGEEFCFRGFLMNRLSRLFGDRMASWIVALILSSVLFGWGHTEQGVTGWIQEGLSGLYLGIMFLASGKNLLLPMISHGVSNTLAFVLIYFGNYPGV